MDPRSGEASPLGWRVGVDGEALTVDDHMMVEPTEGGEVVGVGSAAFGPGSDVVCLEAVSGDAARNGAEAAVAMHHEPAQPRRDDA